LIFLFGALVLFFALKYYFNTEIDDRLQETRKILNIELTELDSLPPTMNILDKMIEIQPHGSTDTSQIYSDTLLWSERDEEFEPYRKLTYFEEINNNNYRVSINHSKLDSEELLATIVVIVLALLGFLLLVVNIFNRYLALRIWKPFYKTINNIRDFSFDNGQPLRSEITVIDEFNILNSTLEQMTSKVLSDYESLKHFTENASHEIQTPLAIIKNKIELLIQQDDLSKGERDAIMQIQGAASRLSKLNSSLLLLTRIENRQYTDSQSINFKELIKNKLEQFEPMISSKAIKLDTQLNDVKVLMDPILAEVLMNNLLGNAIKHNYQSGEIQLNLNDQKLNVNNTGDMLEVSTESLFERFQKGRNNSNSLGLGLAIVKEICKIYHFDIDYRASDSWHEITIQF
jgi:signal transduction histidine kinase